VHASAADLIRLRKGTIDLTAAKKRRALTYNPKDSARIEEFERVLALDSTG
jgi:hypothetical protein